MKSQTNKSQCTINATFTDLVSNMPIGDKELR